MGFVFLDFFNKYINLFVFLSPSLSPSVKKSRFLENSTFLFRHFFVPEIEIRPEKLTKSRVGRGEEMFSLDDTNIE